MTRAFDAFRDHGMEAVFSIIGFTTADIMMWPAAILWDDELSAQQTAAIFGAVDMKLERSGNKASLTYNLDGEAVSFTGEPTDGADGFVFSFIQGGHEKLRSEFVRTPYGFAGQYFLTDDDGKARHYMVTIAGEEGAIGIDQDAVRPGPLTGKESLDFPLTASEWYRIEGKQLTGLTGDGFNIEATIP